MKFMKYIKWMSLEDISTEGGIASFGEKYQQQSKQHTEMPNGFSIIKNAYSQYLDVNSLQGLTFGLFQQYKFI